MKTITMMYTKEKLDVSKPPHISFVKKDSPEPCPKCSANQLLEVHTSVVLDDTEKLVYYYGCAACNYRSKAVIEPNIERKNDD